MKIFVPLKHGVAKFEYVDYLMIMRNFRSIYSRKDKKRRSAYVYGRKNDGSTCFAHSFLMSPEKGFFVDHINHNGLDNTRNNLRTCTISENNRNTRGNKNTSSRYKGVSYNSLNKNWRAKITFNKKTYEIGSYNCEHEAGKAYNEKAKELHGEFAYLNILNKTSEV